VSRNGRCIVASAGRDFGASVDRACGLSLSWLLDFNAGIQGARGGSPLGPSVSLQRIASPASHREPRVLRWTRSI